MAITIKQSPQSVYVKHTVHQCIYPEYYTAYSDQYSNYSDFKYKFKLYTTSGLVSTTKNPPYISDGAGVYNPNLYLQSLLGVDFNPTSTTWATCPNSILNYRVVVDEFSNSLSSPDSADFTKAVVIKCSKEDFNYLTHQMNYGYDREAGGKFLTNWSSTRNVALTGEYGTLRFLNGILNPYSLTENSRIYEMYVKVIRGSTIRHYTYGPNPYWINSVTGPSAINTTLEDLQSYLLEFPVCPQQINAMNWTYRGIESGGIYFPASPPTKTNNILIEGDEYWVYTYCWPYGINGFTSLPMKFKVNTPCSKRKPIQLHWENSLGGFDFFTFNKVNTKSYKIKSSNYRQVRDKMSSIHQYYMDHNNYSRGETTYCNDVETLYLLNTDWLTNQEIKDLEDLWYSKNIFALIEGSWYPVVSITDAQIIESTATGLRQYKFEMRLSNKKYV